MISIPERLMDAPQLTQLVGEGVGIKTLNLKSIQLRFLVCLFSWLLKKQSLCQTYFLLGRRSLYSWVFWASEQFYFPGQINTVRLLFLICILWVKLAWEVSRPLISLDTWDKKSLDFLLKKIYFIDYAITIVPFPPLYSLLPCTSPPTHIAHL